MIVFFAGAQLIHDLRSGEKKNKMVFALFFVAIMSFKAERFFSAAQRSTANPKTSLDENFH